VAARPENWVALPIQGAVLRKFFFRGNGRHSAVRIDTDGHPPIVVPTDYADLSMTFESPTSARLHPRDDLNLELEVMAPSGAEITLVRAEVDWWLEPEVWEQTLERFRTSQEWELKAAFRLRVGFGARTPG
jgi:hypothetical protein